MYTNSAKIAGLKLAGSTLLCVVEFKYLRHIISRSRQSPGSLSGNPEAATRLKMTSRTF